MVVGDTVRKMGNKKKRKFFWEGCEHELEVSSAFCGTTCSNFFGNEVLGRKRLDCTP
ncbi:hypothetical protein BGX38DRAFT_1162021 [Terfezia claveryi]|nr:hypothetical protein BGX38DRAFT_1162021 [Terfezia claveryi]